MPRAGARRAAHRVVREDDGEHACTPTIEGEREIEARGHVAGRRHAREGLRRVEDVHVAERHADPRTIVLGGRDAERAGIARREAEHPDGRGRAVLADQLQHERAARLDRALGRADSEAHSGDPAAPHDTIDTHRGGIVVDRRTLVRGPSSRARRRRCASVRGWLSLRLSPRRPRLPFENDERSENGVIGQRDMSASGTRRRSPCRSPWPRHTCRAPPRAAS